MGLVNFTNSGANQGSVRQRLHGGRHDIHTGHQDGKAQQNGADAPLAVVLTDHPQADTNHRQKRGKVFRLQQHQDNIVALDIRQAQQPRRDGGTHIGAHNHTQRLLEGHHAAVDEAHQHHGHRAGAVDGRGHHKAQQKCPEPGARHGAQDTAQRAAGLLFQRLAHGFHTEQEQRHTAQQGKDVKDPHCFHSLVLFQNLTWI